MNTVFTPDGWGRVLRTQSAHGRTSYLVKGAGFEGWYDGLQVEADFADQPDDVIPNDDNETILPYPSRPQGPGWDGTNSTIQPGIDPHLEMGGASDSLTGEPTDEDPVEADIEGLFEPHARLAGAPRHRLHFATSDDPILDVSTIPDDSPTGLEESPINPDGVDTDDLFDGSLPHFERESAAYDRLVIKNELSFLKYADAEDSDDDHKREQRDDDSRNDDDDDSQDGDSDDENSDDSSDSDSSDGDSSDGGGDGDGGSGGHTAAFALSTTADLHFLANVCLCSENAPLHSKLEHREIQAEAAVVNTPPEDRPPANGVTPQEYDQAELDERYRQDQLFHPAPLDLVDHSNDDGDGANLYNHYASVDDPNHKIKYEGGMPGIRSGKTTPAVATCSCGARANGATRAKAKSALTHKTASVGKQADGYDKYIGGEGDHYYLIASGGGKLPKGEHYGHYDSYQDAHDAVEAIIARNHSRHGSKTAAPAQQEAGPTQIESQIEQLMQFWAVDNNGWWHWTGSQSDLALLNQMQQQMMAVGMPGGPPGQMQTQSAVHTANPALLLPLLEGGEAAGGAEAAGAAAPGGEGAAAGNAGGMLSGAQPPSPADVMSGMADAISGFNGGRDLGVARHVPFQTYGFVIEASTPAPWREYLQTIASDRLVALAAWKDVVQKSKRLRAEGAINVEAFRPDVITAYVQGDNGRYYTTVQRLGSVQGLGRQGLTSAQVSGWSCECDWGHWAWLRKRSFVGRMCSHAYALFSEMRSLDAKARKTKGQPGRFASVKTPWTRDGTQFVWVTQDPAAPTASIVRTASGWNAQVWSDGTAEDSLNLGDFQHSKYAMRAVARVVNAHVKFAESDYVDMVGNDSEDDAGAYPPYSSTDSIPGGGFDPYTEDGRPESLLPAGDQPGSPGIQEGNTRTGSLSVFAEQDDGQDDEGSDETDDGIEEENPEDESIDEEIAEDEDNSDDGSDEDGGEDQTEDDSDDGGHDEPHKRDEEDGDEGTDNPGDDSDDEGIEKHSSVTELQEKFGLSHLAGADYSLSEQNRLVREGEGKSARNRGDLNLTGTHYEANGTDDKSPEDTLAFLF